MLETVFLEKQYLSNFQRIFQKLDGKDENDFGGLL